MWEKGGKENKTPASPCVMISTETHKHLPGSRHQLPAARSAPCVPGPGNEDSSGVGASNWEEA